MTDKPDNVTQLYPIDASDFRVAAADAKGHSVSKTVRIQPVAANAISVLMNSRAFPYKTEAELIRHAIMRHLRWLETIGDVPSVSGAVYAANLVLKEDQMYEEYQETFNSLRNRINDYIRRGDQSEARRLVLQMRGHFDRMPDCYWKDQYKKQLEEWNWLFDNVPKVQLLNFSKD